MSVDDSGWGSDDGWQDQPAGAQPPPPPVPPATLPPGPPVPPIGPPRRSRARKPLIYGAIGVVVILVALTVIGAVTGDNKPKHHDTTATTLKAPSSVTTTGGGSVTTLPAPTATTTPTSGTSPTTDTTSTTSESPNQELLSLVPFTGCQPEAAKYYVSQNVATQVSCASGSNVSAISAEEVAYAAFTDRTTMADEYTAGFLQPNHIVAGTGNCQTLNLYDEDGAHYCEGSVTDANGAVGHEVMIAAPIANAVSIGQQSVATACQGSSGYTFMAFTIPGEAVLGLALNCTESAQIVQSFQAALTKGELDLKS